jgi:hypothetical protein
MSGTICNEMYQFASTNRLLSIATLGIAIAIYGVVIWIRQCCGTSKKTSEVAQERLSPKASANTITETPARTIRPDRFTYSADESASPQAPRSPKRYDRPTFGEGVFAPSSRTLSPRPSASLFPRSGADPLTNSMQESDSLFAPSRPEQHARPTRAWEISGVDSELSPRHSLSLSPRLGAYPLTNSMQESDSLFALSRPEQHARPTRTWEISAFDSAELSPRHSLSLSARLGVDPLTSSTLETDSFLAPLSPKRLDRLVDTALPQVDSASSDDQAISAIDFTKITSQSTFNDIFDTAYSKTQQTKKLIGNLPMETIYRFAEYFEVTHWSYLSDDQISKIDFSKIIFDKGVFSRVFCLYSSQTAKLFPRLSVDTIYLLKEYFNKDHWTLLSVDQIIKLDFSKFEIEQREEIFKNLFPWHGERTQKLLSGLSLDTIYMLADYFKREHWPLLSDEQIIKLDFTKFEKEQREEIFKNLLPWHSKRTEKLLPDMSLNTIYLLANYFKREHWPLLSDDQIIKLDFTKFEKEQRDEIFKNLLPWHSKRTEKLLPEMSLETIYLLAGYFKNDHWSLLSYKQITKFDFTKIEMDKTIFSRLFSVFSEERKKLLAELSLDSIYLLVQYFDSDHWFYLSYEQIPKLDFTKIEMNKDIFNRIFSVVTPDRIKLANKLSYDKIYLLADFFESDHWRALSDDKILNLDFAKIKIDKREAIFDIIFSSYNPRTEKLLPQMPDEQLKILKEYFNDIHRGFLPLDKRNIL